MKIVFLSKGRPELAARLPQGMEFIVAASGPGGVYAPEELAKVTDADAFVVTAEPVNEQILAAAKKLKIVQRLGVGYDTLDLAAAAKRGIPCCNVAGVNKEAVAEHALAMALALAKRLPEAERLTRAGKWAEARLLTKHTFELKGKTLGIVGFGAIGTHLARRARGVEMPIVYNDIRDIDAKEIEATGARFMEKPQLFAAADIVSIHTTLNDGTRGMVNEKMLSLMKPGAILICCARGNIVDEAALRRALDSGKLGGAGIDVFSDEPTLEGNPLFGAPNTILTPHIAGGSREALQRSMAWALDNVRRVVERGEKPQWVVNGV